MKTESKVLACVDQSPYAAAVTDYAAWAAKTLDAGLELLHVIERESEMTISEDHSGALGVDAQEQLLSELTERDQVRHRSVREAGRLFLNELRERARLTGLTEVDVRQRMGTLQEAVADRDDDVSLYVLGRRGVSAASTQRDIGRNVQSLVRKRRQPILAVTDEFVAPKRVLLAFDGSQMTRRGVAMIASGKLFKDLPVHVLMAGHATSQGARQLEWARQLLKDAGFDVHTHQTPGDPETEITKAIKDLQVDILAMGAYSHSPWRSLFFGSKTTDLLRSAPIATLLLR